MNDLDFGFDVIPGIIASSSTEYLQIFAPLFLLVAGLILAVSVISLILNTFFPRKEKYDPFDDVIEY